MTKLQQMIEDTKKLVEEKSFQGQQVQQSIQQSNQQLQLIISEHNAFVARLNTLTEIEAAGDGLKEEVPIP